MKPTRFHESARRELREAALSYDDRQPGLGDRWLVIFEATIQRIRGNPGVGRPAAGGLARQCRLPDFPYNIVFQNRAADVYIVAVAHLSRRPGYWIDRLGDGEP